MLWWMLATLCAFFVKGLCGFANTLVFTTILSFGSSNLSITPVELLLGFPTNLILAWKERKSIQWKICVPLIVLVLAGNIPGIFLLKNADSRGVKILFGLVIVGIGAARPLLELMGTPEDVINKSVLYMRVYFAGMPVIMLYNFGSAILRAIGDTKRPLYYLMIAGIVNVMLNLFFVISLNMDVAGVALATVAAQCISAGLIVRCLMKSQGGLRLHLKRLRVNAKKLAQIVRIGLPAGMQGAIFSISNVLIQSSVNSFGSVAMAGNTAASNIEGFVYTSMNAVYQTNLSFTSQNIGGKKFSRLNRILYTCMGVVTATGLIMGLGAVAGGNWLLGIYSSDPEVIAYGANRLLLICVPYFICGLMDTAVGSLRGMGYSMLPMVVSLTGACAFRVVWIFTVFASFRSLTVLYISYPISWSITMAAHLFCYFKLRRKFPKEDVQ